MKVIHREIDLNNGVLRLVIEVPLDEVHLIINLEEKERIARDEDPNLDDDSDRE